MNKYIRFIWAWFQHKLTGSQELSNEKVDERHSICKSCPSYMIEDENRGTCLECGCLIRSSKVEGLNKLRWVEQKCPLDKW